MAKNHFPMISKINLVYEISKKEDIYVDIYVDITKCLIDYTELKTYFTYETNVTNIKKVKVYLSLPIEGKNSEIGCIFIKHDINFYI